MERSSRTFGVSTIKLKGNLHVRQHWSDFAVRCNLKISIWAKAINGTAHFAWHKFKPKEGSSELVNNFRVLKENNLKNLEINHFPVI